MGLIRVSYDPADLGQRPQRDDGVGRRVSLDQAGVGQTKLAASRIGMAVGLFVNGELRHGGNVFVAPVRDQQNLCFIKLGLNAGIIKYITYIYC